MKVRDILIGAGIGFLAGYALKEYAGGEQISPEKALKTVKENIQDHIPVNGSWIHMTAENYKKDDLEYKVYRGGISSTKEGETKQMDFIVDAKTGTILELSS
ncbi:MULTISPECIES: PepSY domain-containing protein [Alteribacillus]|uniref:Predicted small secreted protein n=1 Tax=Alteribacillus bidgolensis TaxID=930129 RepID=A0A1G8ERM9_9BACI|nr:MULTISPECIES: PepSY domain-containing protein [Alteribacillus]SDH72525.1 Predicted small secreted protein [Alteribacillus bidgolensis]